MKLYHASKHTFAVLKRNQVEVPDDVVVPDAELQNKIYLTPDIGFAIALAAGPSGMTSLKDGCISFENFVQFDPECPVYVYVVESDSIPADLIQTVDGEQVAVDLDELKPDTVQEFLAKDVFGYYKLTDWQHPSK